MRHTLRSDIVRVLYEQPRNIDEIRSAVLLLRIKENRAGPLRRPLIVFWPFNIALHVYWRPKIRQIKSNLRRLEWENEQSRVYQDKHNRYILTERGEETYQWYMSKFS